MGKRLRAQWAEICEHPIQACAKAATAAFVFFHISALCWWLIPAGGYPKDRRSMEPAEWVSVIEQQVFTWKRMHATTSWARAFESYIFIGALWQKWWLFAPNPTDGHDWVTVKAIVGWKDPDPAIPPEQRKTGVWGDAREPIYDSEPLYGSYEGNLADPGALAARMRGTAGWYFHDPKLIEGLASGDWDRPLASFAEYWGKMYRIRTGKKPLGVHVILTHGTIPPSFSGRTPASVEPSTRVLWYVHY